MEQRDKNQNRQTLLRDGLISFGVVLLAFGAVDDITTDNAPTFLVERIALVCAGAWFVFLAFRLWQGHLRLVAVISVAMIGLAAWAQPLIGPGTVPNDVAYLTTIAGLAWFLFVAAFLVSIAWRLRHRRAVQ
jgi:hypothetical protein